MSNYQRTTLAVSIVAGLFTTIASADVTMQQRIEIQAGGALSMLNSTTNVTTLLSGDKSRSDTVMDTKPGMMGRLMKAGGNTSNITRLDKELIWTLSAKKKQYTEMTFEEMRAQMKRSMEQMESLQDTGSSSSTLPVSEESCQWSPMVVNTDKTGKKEKFAGVKATQYIINISSTCTDKASGKACNIIWTLDNWMAKKMPGNAELNAYQKAMAEKMDMGQFISQGQGMSAVLLKMFGDGWSDIFEEADDLKGYPIKSVMSLEMGGENCTMPSGQTLAMDEVWGDAANAGLNAGVGSAASHAGRAAGQEIAGQMGNSVGGSIAGSALGAASSEVIGGLFNKFKKKKKPKQKSQQKPADTAEKPGASSVAIFRVATEIINISDASIPAAKFEIPAGYKKR
ncbi:MAG: complement resistance protein TraT [Xanthomonadales bacterium]|nr:complement resistance protein TraT [Xanthomonadales bacterium]